MIKGLGSAGTKPAAMDTLIGRQTEIVGDVRFSGGLHVDGRHLRQWRHHDLLARWVH